MATGWRLSAATGLHKGDRDYQQDQVTVLAHSRVPGCLLAVVADGIGGRSGGRKAADQVILTARQLFERYVPAREGAAALLRQLVHDAHVVIQLTAIATEEEPHSTAAAFLVNPDGNCHWTHVGDSRLHHFRGAALVRRSIDHSYVQTLVTRGEITREEALGHPQSNILIACLGSPQAPPAEVAEIGLLGVGDCVLACSDGLWHYLSDEELGWAVAHLPPREASQWLVDKARTRSRGGGDNLSVAIVRIDPLGA